MTLSDDFLIDNSIKLAVSLVLGALMGAEREYKGRNIGFRTIILVTVGSTLFTIISSVMGGATDPTRIAANVVTGVGFLGAGAIFRDGFTVKGVTTASLIWVSAAVGMACGIGQYEFSLMVTATVLVVLIGFTGTQNFIDRYNKEQIYKVTFKNEVEIKEMIEGEIRSCGLHFNIVNYYRADYELTIMYQVRGSQDHHNSLVNFLMSSNVIRSFST